MQHSQSVGEIGKDLGDALTKEELRGAAHCKQADSKRVRENRPPVAGIRISTDFCDLALLATGDPRLVLGGLERFNMRESFLAKLE